MPSFDDSTTTTGLAEDVWKLLYDPARFPEWWIGVATVEKGGPGDYVQFLQGYPDFPMPQTLTTAPQDSRVTVSCQVSDIVFDWHLEPLEHGTAITVHVEIPEVEAHRLDALQGTISGSLRNLAALVGTAG